MVAEKRQKKWAEAEHGPFACCGKPVAKKNPAKKQCCDLESPI
jgi:hypothetical protein